MTPQDRPARLDSGGPNAIGRMLGLLGDEWTLLIIQQALMGAHRYTEFMSRLPISNSVLTKRLRVLVDEDLLTTEYRTTARSRALWPVLLTIWQWERVWVPEHHGRLPAMRHTRCGELFSPALRCTACGAAVHDGAAVLDGVDLTVGPSGQWHRSAPTASTRRRSDGAVGIEGGPARHAGLFPQTMAVLGNRWAVALLLAAFLGTSRFTEFQTQLGAPPSLLTERLQTFCDIGVLRAAPARAGSERAVYLLTPKGHALSAILVTALQWAHRWFLAPEGPAIVVTHRGCGADLVAELCCDRCDEALSGAQVEVTAVAAAGIP